MARTNTKTKERALELATAAWLRGGVSVFELPPDAAVHIQRFIIMDGERFDEAAYRRRHRAGVEKAARAGSHLAALVLSKMED